MRTPSKLQRGIDPDSNYSVTLTLNPKLIEIVSRLYASGLWGDTPKEVCERLFCEACKVQAGMAAVEKTS